MEIDPEAVGEPFVGATDGPSFEAMARTLEAPYGRDVALLGQGGSIPLRNDFRETFRDAEIMPLGVEEPLCLIHAPNESVDPSGIERTALAGALFLRSSGASTAGS